MSVPRNPVFSQITPRHNQLPLGAGLWWPLHGSFVGMPDTPSATEIVVAGSANASKWSADTLMYAFPADNGNTDSVGLVAQHDDDAGASSIDQVLTLNGAAVGTQVLIACTAWWVDQQTQAGYLWAYGTASSANSFFGINLGTGDKLQFVYQGKSASTLTTLNDSGGLTLTGTALESFTRSADVQIVCSLHVTSATAAAIEIRCGNGTSSALYTGTLDATANSGTALPGQGDRTAAQHVGFGIGCRPEPASSITLPMGRGASPSNSARIGNVCARRYTSYDSGRALQAVTDLLARRDDYPDSWLT